MPQLSKCFESFGNCFFAEYIHSLQTYSINKDYNGRLKMQDRKMPDKSAGLQNAVLEIGKS